jgi:polar amino acid transport system substrate-binding protein
MPDRQVQPRQPSVFVKLTLTVLLALMGFTDRSEAAELSDIRQRGYLVVGVKDNLRPLGFRGENGELQGLEIDLARWLAEQLLGNADAVVLQPLTNQDRLSALLEDDVDLVIAALSMTVSRSRLVDFSTPYYLDGTALISRNEALRSVADLRQQSIAVLRGSDAIAVVRSNLPSAQLVGVESYEQAKAMLDTNQVAAFAGDASVLTGWIQQYPDYYLMPQMLSTEALAVAMPRGRQYTELRQQVNQAIQQWQRAGTLENRILDWGLPETGVPRMNLRNPQINLQINPQTAPAISNEA